MYLAKSPRTGLGAIPVRGSDAGRPSDGAARLSIRYRLGEKDMAVLGETLVQRANAGASTCESIGPRLGMLSRTTPFLALMMSGAVLSASRILALPEIEYARAWAVFCSLSASSIARRSHQRLCSR